MVRETRNPGAGGLKDEPRKYELLPGQAIKAGVRKLFRIRALRDFGGVRAGDIGGYIESERNLSHDGNAWVSGDARVFGNARVYGDARVFGGAWVFGNARVSGDARVFGNAWVCGDAQVSGNARGDERGAGAAERKEDL